MPNPTKAELQTELRQLNKGFPRIAVSKLKVHELEAHIETLRKYKSDSSEAIATKTPVLPGPKGSREIPVKEVESGDVIIHTPQMPPQRMSKVPPKKVRIVAAESDSDDQGPPAPLPKVRATPEGKVLKTGEVTVPKKMKKAKVVAVADAVAAPVAAPHTKSLATHYCNCPSCPTKHKKE
jgi:hypothetical protein